jgi:hypothetical protein
VEDHRAGYDDVTKPLLRITELGLKLSALGDIDERDDGARDLTTMTDRMRPILDREGCSIGTPKYFIVGVSAPILAKPPEYFAILLRVGCSIGPAMVRQLVHIPAQQLFRLRKTKQPGTRGIGECAFALQVDPVDGFAGGVQQQADVFFAFAQSDDRAMAFDSKIGLKTHDRKRMQEVE